MAKFGGLVIKSLDFPRFLRPAAGFPAAFCAGLGVLESSGLKRNPNGELFVVDRNAKPLKEAAGLANGSMASPCAGGAEMPTLSLRRLGLKR